MHWKITITNTRAYNEKFILLRSNRNLRVTIPEGHLVRGGHESLRFLGEVAVTFGRQYFHSERQAPSLRHVSL